MSSKRGAPKRPCHKCGENDRYESSGHCKPCLKPSVCARKAHIKENGPFGVYLAKYPYGDYIGSGNLVRRREDHMHSRNHPPGEPNQFIILLECPKDQCRALEDFFIKFQGLDNLINKNYALKTKKRTTKQTFSLDS